MIKQSDIDRVLDACNIVDVVRDYSIQLKQKGRYLFACCPFHQEKTGSFCVSPETDTYHCFGCHEHGNSISFVIKHDGCSFPEAVKKLAEKYNIDIEESESSAQDEMIRKQKEAMYIANDILAKYYHELLLNNVEASKYAFGRWNEEYCKKHLIGYCPPDARLIDKLGISNEIVEQLGLKNKGGYDFFNERVVIPIRDRNQHIIGFTARLLQIPKDMYKDKEKEPPKYMNSKESIIYDKKSSFFGSDTAWGAIFRTGICHIVEGASDCIRLHLIGVPNTLAPLGTAWTEEHCAIIKKKASHICFVPDADPPKPNEKYGPGIKAVMESGEAAMKYGFTVSVKQIPIGKKKKDPDSYCKDKAKFDKLKETDFILWLAELLFEKGMTAEQESKVINRLASLMTTLSDETTVDRYISKLTKYVPGKRTWQKALDAQRNEQAEAEAKAKAEKDSDLFKKYGFNIEKDKHYYSISDKGGVYVWSNFIMTPLYHIRDSVNPKRIYLLKNERGQQELLELKQEDLCSLQRFMVKVEGLGNFIWKATNRELQKLKELLYEVTDSAEEIVQLGWQSEGFFAFGNGIFHDGKFLKTDDVGIVRLPEGNYYLPANSSIYSKDKKLFQFERRFVHLGLSTISLKELTNHLFRVFGNNGRMGFLFLLATLNRDIVTRVTRSFPILNLFGPKGSGKSELGHTLMSFFIIDNVPPNIHNSTKPALCDTVAAVSNALVHLDEYKNEMEPSKIEFLKGLWDGTGRTRKNMDLDKKSEVTSVDSGVILSGQEMPTADNALFSRIIFLSFKNSSFSEEERANFLTLNQIRKQGLTHLTLEILSHRKKVEGSFRNLYHQTMMEVSESLKEKGKDIEDRIMMNWVSPLTVFRCLESAIDTSLSYKEMFNICVEGIRFQNSHCKQNNELSNFWKVVMYLVGENLLVDGGDYRVEYLHRLNTDKYKREWQEAHPVLYVQKSRLFMLYKKNGKAVGDNILSESSLEYYLLNSRAYLGYKKGVRFKVFHGGVQKFKSGGEGVPESKVFQAYCFDYGILEEDYGINLELASDDDGDTAHKEDYDAAHPKQQTLDL